MDSIHERLLKVYDALLKQGIVHSQSELGDKIGKTRQQMSMAFNDVPKRCTLGLMKTIAKTFPRILNENYLLTGVGPVLNPKRNSRPHYSVRASAGLLTGIAEYDTEETTSYLPIYTEAGRYDFTLLAEGLSMEPTIFDGDRLFCSVIERRMDGSVPVRPGDLVVVSTRDGVIVKELTGITANSLELRSHNTNYPQHITIDFTDLLSLARVTSLYRPLCRPEVPDDPNGPDGPDDSESSESPLESQKEELQ